MESVNLATRSWLEEQLAVSFQIEKHSYSHQDEVYVIQTPRKRVFLKISSNLESERRNLIKVGPYLNVPLVLAFKRVENKDHLLLSEVPGNNLAEFIGVWSNEEIVKEFARAVRVFHQLDPHVLFPNKNADDLVVLHGDMALPNIMCQTPGKAGYIDLGQMYLGKRDADLADAIWSLQRNLGPEYGELFLKEYGNVVMTEKIEKALQFRYSIENDTELVQ
jgi:aminoglycoside phosphotransferase